MSQSSSPSPSPSPTPSDPMSDTDSIDSPSHSDPLSTIDGPDSDPDSDPYSDTNSNPFSDADSDGTPALRARSLSPQFLTPTQPQDSPLSKGTPALRARPISPLFAALYGTHYDTPGCDPLSDPLSDNDESSPVTDATARLQFSPISPLYAAFYGTPSDDPYICDLILSTNRSLTVDHNSNRRDDCKAQTSGYSGAQFKSFNTSQEAMEYMGGGGRGGQRSHGTSGNSSSSTAAGGDTYDNLDDDEDFAGDTIYGRPVSQIRSSGFSEPRFEMYTDGACHGNGMAGARAGIGVHFPNRPDKDISEPLAGRQTNNRAEIQAARRALEVAKELGHSRVEIKTDSEFMNKSVNEWSHKWRQNNWRTSAGNEVLNKQDFLDLEAASRGMDIKWTKVPAHSGVAGNEKADQLANQGVDKQPSRGDQSSRYQGSDIRRYT